MIKFPNIGFSTTVWKAKIGKRAVLASPMNPKVAVILACVAGGILGPPKLSADPEGHVAYEVFRHWTTSIVIEAELAGETGLFIVEPALSMCLVDSRYAELLERSGTPTAEPNVFLNIPLDIGLAEIEVTAATSDLSESRRASGLPLMGLIGSEALTGYSLELDLVNGKMELSKENPLKPLEGDTVVEISRQQPNGPPLLTMTLNLPDSGKTELPALVGFTEYFGLRFPSEHFHQLVLNGVIGNVTALPRGGVDLPDDKSSRPAQNMSALGVIGEMESMGIEFTQLEVRGVVQEPNVVMGRQFLARFIVRIDFPNQVAYFRPHPDYKDPYPMAERFGAAVFFPQPHRPEVVHVAPGEAADRAGVRVGDQILKYGELEDEALHRQAMFDHTEARDGEEIKITVLRDGESIVLTLVPGS